MKGLICFIYKLNRNLINILEEDGGPIKRLPLQISAALVVGDAALEPQHCHSWWQGEYLGAAEAEAGSDDVSQTDDQAASLLPTVQLFRQDRIRTQLADVTEELGLSSRSNFGQRDGSASGRFKISKIRRKP